MKKPLTLSLVIPVYNEQYHLKHCLEAISKQTSAPDEIIVVDNNSTDNTADIARQFSSVRVVSENRQGVLYASRRGFDEASSEIICRIDADSILNTDWIQQVRTYFDTNPETAAVTGDCYFYDFPLNRAAVVLHDILYYNMQKLIAGTEVVWGSNMAITASAWRKVRSDCITHTGIHEDIDLSFHLQKNHLLIRRSASLVVGVSLMRGQLKPSRLLRYFWPWPSNTLHSYFWSWPRTYWINRRYAQSALITIMLVSSGLAAVPVLLLMWLVTVRQDPLAGV